MTIDDATGRHAARRLRQDLIAWMTTVSPAGQPQTSPVWFWWDGDEFRVYSLESARVRNIEENPKVTLNLDGNGIGGDIVIVEGEAIVDRSLSSAAADEEYVAKYRHRMDENGWTPEWFATHYPVPIRIHPTRYRYW